MQTQVNSATGIMGVTGSGKSALLATLARYVWDRYKKVTLYYNTDGGGFPAPIQELQALGIMRVFRMRTRDPGDLGLSFETCYRACQGWWPKRINPRSGEVPPGVEMVPPVAVRFTMRCPEGHVVKVVPTEALLTPGACPTCRKMVSKTDMQVEKGLVRNAGFDDVGAVCYDGLSSMLSWELLEMGHRAGRLELRGEEAAIGGKIISGSLRFGGTTRSHVGFAQTRGEELVHLTLGIPNLVVPPVFTMLTHEDVDERGLDITGPKISGRAKTDESPQWFGNLLESAKVPALEANTPGEQRVLYLSEFIRDGRRHLCKHRGSPGMMPPYLADPVGTDETGRGAFSEFNLGRFFQLLDLALEKGVQDRRSEIPDAPGLPETEWVDLDSGISIPAPVPVSVQPGAAPTAPNQVPPPAAPPAAQPKRRAARKGTAAAQPAQAPPVSPQPPAAAPVAQAPAGAPQQPTLPVDAPQQPAPEAPHPRGGMAPPAGMAPAVSVSGPAASAPKPPAGAPRPPAAPRAAAPRKG